MDESKYRYRSKSYGEGLVVVSAEDDYTNTSPKVTKSGRRVKRRFSDVGTGYSDENMYAKSYNTTRRSRERNAEAASKTLAAKTTRTFLFLFCSIIKVF